MATFASRRPPTARTSAATQTADRTAEEHGDAGQTPDGWRAAVVAPFKEPPGFAPDAEDHWLTGVEAAYDAATGHAQPAAPPAMRDVTETPGLASDVEDHWLAGVEAAYDVATGHAEPAAPPAMRDVTETPGFASDAEDHWLTGVEAAYDAATGHAQPAAPPAMRDVTETPGLAPDVEDHWLAGVEAAYDTATGPDWSTQPGIVAIGPSAIDVEPVAEKRADLEDWVQGKEETSTVRRGSSPPSSTGTKAKAISRLSQLNADLDRVAAIFARSRVQFDELMNTDAPANALRPEQPVPDRTAI